MQIGSLISRAAQQFKDKPCLIEGDRIVSFRQFDELTNRVANALLSKDLSQGDRVGVLMPNSVDCLVVYYALAKAGLVRVSLNTRETIENHRYKLSDSGSRCCIHSGEWSELGVEFEIEYQELRDMMSSGDKSICMSDRALDAPLRLGYTGGTTGQPKGVTLTTRGELAELLSFLSDLVPGLGPDDRFLHAAPIAHASGAFFLPALVRGACSIVMKSFDPNTFIALAEESQATTTFLVPTMLAMVMEEQELEGANLNFTRICYGASPISHALLQRAQQRFGKVFAQTYGQAESPMVITYLAPEDHDRIGSCGRPFTCVDVAVFKDEKPVPVGEIGEVVCRGPQTMAYYWGRPEATKKAFKNGWLHTGDIGKMDEDGFFYILDRKNDMLISGGYNVYPREVEDVLLSFKGVIEAAVVGLPDEKWGDRVYAVVVAREGVIAEDIMSYAKKHLASFKAPKAIEIWPELPKSAANKILRREVRNMLIKQQEEVSN